MEEKKLSQEESLELIQSMISTAANRVTEKGFHFLLWGILVIVASLSQYFMIRNGMGNESGFVWLALPVIGVPIALMYERRKDRKETTCSHSERSYGLLWLAFGITLVVVIFVSAAYNMSAIPFILALAGLATFVSGSIYRFTPLILGGIVFWLAAIGCVFISMTDQLLLNAGAIFLGYILPGIALWKKSRSTAHV